MKIDRTRDSFGHQLALAARLQRAAVDGRFSTDLLCECQAWGLGETDRPPEKRTPAKGGRARAGKR